MHAETLSQHAQACLARLGKSGILTPAYLAGGSALALHLGHRRSYDFDFYTPESLLVEDIAAQLGRAGTFSTTLLEPPHTLLGEFEGVKLSLFRYNYPLVKPTTGFKGVAIASVEDIAAMKLSAITGRATKRDYVDLFCLTKIIPLEEQFELYDKKYGNLGNNLYTLIKALGFFEDAETDEMPHMIKPIRWEDAKGFFANESLRLGRKLLGV